MGGFFEANTKSDPDFLLMVLSVLAMLSVLPIGVIAVFRPRFAAYAVATAWLVLMVSACVSIRYYEHVNWGEIWRSAPISELLRPLVWYLALPICIIALLLYGSTPEGRAAAVDVRTPDDAEGESTSTSAAMEAKPKIPDAQARVDRRRQALWAGVILGVLAGAWHLRLGLSLALRFAGAHRWISVAGVTASSLTLLPFAIVGIWKPRLAGYLLAGSFVLAVVYPLLGARNLADAVVYLLWGGVPAVPLALVAGLLLYASLPRKRVGQQA
jgi:hypothetical protein